MTNHHSIGYPAPPVLPLQGMGSFLYPLKITPHLRLAFPLADLPGIQGISALESLIRRLSLFNSIEGWPDISNKNPIRRAVA